MRNPYMLGRHIHTLEGNIMARKKCINCNGIGMLGAILCPICGGSGYENDDDEDDDE